MSSAEWFALGLAVGGVLLLLIYHAPVWAENDETQDVRAGIGCGGTLVGAAGALLLGLWLIFR